MSSPPTDNVSKAFEAFETPSMKLLLKAYVESDEDPGLWSDESAYDDALYAAVYHEGKILVHAVQTAHHSLREIYNLFDVGHSGYLARFANESERAQKPLPVLSEALRGTVQTCESATFKWSPHGSGAVLSGETACDERTIVLEETAIITGCASRERALAAYDALCEALA